MISPISAGNLKQEKAMNWQPIETDPKDGSVFLVHGPYGFFIASWGGELFPYWCFESPGEGDCEFTHWSPLEPPK